MEMKHVVDSRLLFLLLLIIGCAAVPAVQCRSNGDMLGEKINIPPGPLCAKRPDLCKNCWCCEVSDGQCYQSLEACQVNCPLPSPPAI
uniref:Embryo surrounding factor 1 brassicaceae domain-containing protein n=1 Tax=Oryza glaberrima TaxID=4538 RepID=I1NYP6_ORYGL